jgi:Zn-dependent peptidase ImmA (M78 family)
VTAREAGWIFVDAHDPPDEQNFSLAHELAHFLRHELQRRQRLQAALGPQADALLQGSRKANSDERLAGVLRQVEWQAYTHLLQREGGHLTPGVQKAEQEADLLAVELLAPEAVFWSHGPTDAPSAQRIYREIFGLPEAIAVAQAERLFPAPATGAISQRMRNFLVKRRTSEA